MKTAYQFQTFAEYQAYLEGYYDGVENYAVWKDGKQYVGVMQKPLYEIKNMIDGRLKERI